jgi:flap endonuclease-1
MGIKHLNRYFRSACSNYTIVPTHLSSLRGEKIAIDTSIYLYRYSADNALIENLFSMITIMHHYGIIPIFVFDGKPPEEKKALLWKRREEKWLAQKELDKLLNEEIRGEEGNEEKEKEKDKEKDKKEKEEKIKALKKKCTSLDPKKIERVKILIGLLGCQMLQADGEADALCAALAIQGHVYACLSEDMDLFVYGCPRVLRYLSLLHHEVVIYHTYLILNELHISLQDFRRLCVVCGTDYNENIRDLDFKTAMTHYQNYRSKEVHGHGHDPLSLNNTYTVYNYLLDQGIMTQEDVDGLNNVLRLFEDGDPLKNLQLIQIVQEKEKEKENAVDDLKKLLREEGFLYGETHVFPITPFL